MKSVKAVLLGALLVVGAASAEEDVGMGPWRLGMPKEQVVAIPEYGPFKDVSATTVEIPDGKFQKRKSKTAFVFGDTGLRAVEMRVYEGKGWNLAKDAVLDVFDHFVAQYGGANVKDETDNIKRKDLEVMLDRTLGTASGMNDRYAKTGGSVTITFDMVPLRQPAESRLHAQWVYVGKTDTYTVFLYQDLPKAPSREAEDSFKIERP
jgi:hypothetical protein